MHELTAVSRILEIVLHEAETAGATSVSVVSLVNGEWSTFDSDCIESYFRILAQGTPAGNARLAVETIPARYRCEDCGNVYAPSDGVFACPACPASKATLISGREFYIDSIEVEFADTDCEESPGRK